MCSGFEEFNREHLMLEWLNSQVEYRPNISFSAYHVKKKLNVKPQEFITCFVVMPE